MTNKWEGKIGEIVRSTYAREGYKDVTILIGATTKDGLIHTQVWYPEETASEFDFRFLFFSMLNHVFADWNEELTKAQDSQDL